MHGTRGSLRSRSDAAAAEAGCGAQLREATQQRAQALGGVSAGSPAWQEARDPRPQTVTPRKECSWLAHRFNPHVTRLRTGR